MAYLHEKSAGASRAGLWVPLGVACALHLVLGQQVSLLGGTFNFLAAAACALAPGLEPRRAVLLGFGCGALYDLTSSAPVGMCALLLTIACFALSSSTSGHALGPTPDGFRLSAVGALALEAAYGLGMFLVGADTSFVSAVLVHGLVTGALTAAAACCLLALAPRGEAAPGFSARASKGGRGGRGTRFKGLG